MEKQQAKILSFMPVKIYDTRTANVVTMFDVVIPTYHIHDKQYYILYFACVYIGFRQLCSLNQYFGPNLERRINVRLYIYRIQKTSVGEIK